MRETSAPWVHLGSRSRSCSRPSTRHRTPTHLSWGSTWMSLALISTARVITQFASRTIGGPELTFISSSRFSSPSLGTISRISWMGSFLMMFSRISTTEASIW